MIDMQYDNDEILTLSKHNKTPDEQESNHVHKAPFHVWPSGRERCNELYDRRIIFPMRGRGRFLASVYIYIYIS
jgi:hypothetical protein